MGAPLGQVGPNWWPRPETTIYMLSKSSVPSGACWRATFRSIRSPARTRCFGTSSKRSPLTSPTRKKPACSAKPPPRVIGSRRAELRNDVLRESLDIFFGGHRRNVHEYEVGDAGPEV